MFSYEQSATTVVGWLALVQIRVFKCCHLWPKLLHYCIYVYLVYQVSILWFKSLILKQHISGIEKKLLYYLIKKRLNKLGLNVW